MKPNGGRRPDEILAEIDRTRSEMDRTLTAIEHRLTPGQLVDQGIDYLRHSGANEFVQNLGGTAKQNPMPVALVGIGLAWLMALGRQPAQHQGQGVGFTSSSSSGGIREKASGAMQAASESMETMRGRASQMTETAREQWQKARGGVDYMVREQPLALGAIGLAVGAVLAAMAPRTRKEEELMGEASRNLAEKAKQAGAQQLEKAQEATKEAVAQATRKEPQSSGTTAPPATPTGPRPPRQGT